MSAHLISLHDLSSDGISNILDLTKKIKQYDSNFQNNLEKKNIALVFEKPSNRTRVSFEVGISQLGGNCIYLGPDEIHLGVRESIADVSKTLSRYVDGIVIRTYAHDIVKDFAKNSQIPIINGLSDEYHPCQGLTDVFSIKEKFDNLDDIIVSYIGDGNNVCHSLLLACAKLGISFRVATPTGYEPNSDIVDKAREYLTNQNKEISILNDSIEAAKGANVIYTDVWVSMGQEDEREKRLKDFEGYQINMDLINHAADNCIFMHCLPAHRGEEVSADVIEGNKSIVFDQAENRLHTQKAILLSLFSKINLR